MGACERSSGALAVLLVFLGWAWVMLLLRVGVPVSEAAPLPHEQQPQMGFEEEAEEQERERGGEASLQEGMAMPKQTSSLPPSQQGESLREKMEEVGEKEGENKNQEEERREEEEPQKEEAEEQEAAGEAQEREDQGVWVTVTADIAEADGQPQPQQGESREDEEGEPPSSVSASTQEQGDAGERSILLSMQEAAEEEEQRELPQQQEEELDQSKLQQQQLHHEEETEAKIKGGEEEPKDREEEGREGVGEKEEVETRQQQQQRPATATTRSNNNQSHNKEEAKEAAIGESKEVAATATTPSVPECPTEGDKSKKPKEVIPPLEEWKDKIKSDMEKKEGPGHHHNNKDGKGQQGKKNKNFLSILTERYSNQFNYASEECGAKVLASSPEFQGTSNVLKDAMDVYSMSPCESTKWMVLELCEEIGINALEISNLESFSSTFKEFRVLGSHKWPTTKWVPIGGNFTAQDVRKIQLFTLEEPVWFKYLKFQFLSHYGNQYYCPVTSIRVHGINHVSDLKQKIKQNSQEVNEWTERLKNSEVTDSPSIDKELVLSEKEELQTPPNAIYHETHSSASQEEAEKKKSSVEGENELGGNSVIEEVLGVVDAEDILLNNRSALLSENDATQFGTNTTTTGDHTKEKQEEVVVPFELPSSPSPLPEQVIINSSSAMSPSETSSSPSAETVFTQVQANGIEEQKDSTPSTNIQNLERQHHQSTDVDEHEETGDLPNGDEVQRQLHEGAAMQQKSKDKEDTLQISTKDSEIEKEDGKEEKEFPSRNDENIISRDSETQPATEKDIYFHEIVNTTSSPLILDPPLNTQLEEDVNKVEETEERTVKNNETMTNKDNAEQVLMEVTINEQAAHRLNEEEGNKENDRGKMEEKTEQEQKKEEIQIGKGGDEKAEQIQNEELKRKQEEEKLEKDKKQKDEEISAEQEQADPKNQKQQQQPTITTQQEETSKKIGKKEEEGKENVQQHQRGEEMKVEEKEMEVEVEVEEEFSELELLMMDDSDGEMEELSAGESVFTTLANRMKELEINQSLSNRYLEKVSSRYVESYNELMEELERYSSERASLISLVNDLSKNTSNLEAQLLHNVQQMVDDRVSIATEVLLLEFQDRIDQMQQSFAEERNELLLFMFVAVVIAFFFLHYFHLIMVEAFHYVNSQKQSWRERISSFPSLRRSRRKTSSLPRSRSHEEFRSLLTPKKSSSSSPASSISSPSASSSSIVSIRRSKTSASLQSLYLAASPSNHQSLDLLNINKTNERDIENDSEEEKDIVCYNDDKRDNYNDFNNKKSYRKASSVPATHRDQASSSPSSPASSSSSPSSSQLTSKRHSLPAPFSSSSPLSIFSSFSSSYSTLFGDHHQRKEKQRTKQETAPVPGSSNRLREGERSGIYRYKVSSATSASTAAHSSSSIPSTSSLLAKVKGATNNRKKRRKRKEQLQQQQQRSHKEKSYSLEL